MAEIDKSSVGLSSLNRLTRELEEKKDQVGQRQHRMAVASTAKSKLEGLRQKTCHMKAYNQSTESLLGYRKPSPNGTGETTARLDYTPTSQESTRTSTTMELDMDSNLPETLDAVMTHNRTLRAQVKLLDDENKRYKHDISQLGMEVDGITDESMTTDKNVALLMEDLEKERNNHRKAQESLEQKAREVNAMRQDLAEKTIHLEARDSEVRQARADLISRTEGLDIKTQEVQRKDAVLQEQATKLVAMEAQTQEARRKNMELTARIQEILRERVAADAETELARVSGDGETARGDLDMMQTHPAPAAEEEWMEEKHKLTKELEREKAGNQLKGRQLEAVRARIERMSLELQRYKGGRGGHWTKFIRSTWSVLLTAGWVGFLGFVYILFAEDALRPHGVDVFRFTH